MRITWEEWLAQGFREGDRVEVLSPDHRSNVLQPGDQGVIDEIEFVEFPGAYIRWHRADIKLWHSCGWFIDGSLLFSKRKNEWDDDLELV